MPAPLPVTAQERSSRIQESPAVEMTVVTKLLFSKTGKSPRVKELFSFRLKTEPDDGMLYP